MKVRRRSIARSLALAATLALAAPAIALAQPQPQPQSKIKVAAVYTVPYEQQWVGKLHKALKAAEARGEIDYKSTENVANADYERVLREYATGGAQLLVGEAFAVETAARKVAKDFPKTGFLMGSSGKPQSPNLSVFDNYIQEPAYLTGMIAGGMSKSHKIGMVGGFPIPEVNRLMNAFMAGAREIDPKTTFTVSFINSWFDPPKAKEATFAMIDQGADMLYAERFGVADAAKERGKLAIGNVADMQAQYPDTIVATAVWAMEPSIDRAIALVKQGKFAAEDYADWSLMKNKGSSLAPLGTFDKKVPAELMARVKAREADILAGRFTVKVDNDTPKSSPR